jgi:hypothetical protein
MEKYGWLVNDCLTCIPGTTTFWHNLLEWFPELIDKTNGYTDFSILASYIEHELVLSPKKPHYIIRNGTYFRQIRTDIKQILLIQDVQSDKSQQIRVINNSAVVVFNTEYVYNKYKNIIHGATIKICPLGVDFDFFKSIPERHPSVLPNSLLFIGAATKYPKGFHILLDIIHKMKDQNFCLIMKDNFIIDPSLRNRVVVFNKISKETVRLVINSCRAAICTSYEETQHLSGIECAACNIPIIAREVGVYYDNKDDSRWGCIADDNTFVEKINIVFQNTSSFQPRECFIEKYSTSICKENWRKIIDEI